MALQEVEQQRRDVLPSEHVWRGNHEAAGRDRAFGEVARPGVAAAKTIPFGRSRVERGYDDFGVRTSVNKSWISGRR
jgi:hypothetical protein